MGKSGMAAIDVCGTAVRGGRNKKGGKIERCRAVWEFH